MAFLERFNKTLFKKLFAHQYAEKIKTGDTSCKRVDSLLGIIKAMNDEESRIIGMKPSDEIRLESVKQPQYKEVSQKLPIGSLVKYIFIQTEKKA